MSIELPVATRHRRDMTGKLLKATLNPNSHTHANLYLNCKSLGSPVGMEFSTVSYLEGQVEQIDSIQLHNVESNRSLLAGKHSPANMSCLF